ncbi:AMP-binding protein [Allorhizocola rhizosphaerae]|uniref:AMP-binding protein n=1 Tax=Allorhizocola rhizosphaerae TaxID=1872709 RepID=UPI000E3D99B9|nr:AMP-binding protein [Allorhizocola rhizosphaerae]
MQTIVDAIVDGPPQTGTLTILDSAGEPTARLDWPGVYELARRMSTVLARHGLGPGGRIGLFGESGIGLVTAIQATWLTGGAVTVLPQPGRANRQSHVDSLLAVAADARFGLVLVDDGTSLAAEALRGTTRVLTFADLVGQAACAPPAPLRRPGPDELAVVQYTSGSTRTPQPVPVAHENLLANLRATAAAVGVRPDIRWLSWLPLYHDMGLIGFCCLPMMLGQDLFLQPPLAFALRPGSWPRALARYRATHSGAPNFAYQVLTSVLADAPPYDLSCVRYLVSGGEPVAVPAMAALAQAGQRHRLDPKAFVAAYGLAEATLTVAMSPSGTGLAVDPVDQTELENKGVARPGDKPLARMRIVPTASVRVVDRHTGQTLAPRRVGAIEVSGPSVPGGGPLRTGDLGYLVDDDLVVCGREKDVLFAAGRNVYPHDIEAIAAQVPGVGAVAAFGVPGPRGDRLFVALETTPATPTDLPELVRSCVADEAGMTPTVITVRKGGLPRTSSGKLRRHLMPTLFAAAATQGALQ